DAVVLLLLHREVRAQDLLERVLLLRLPEGVVGAVLHVRLVILGLPGQFLDLLVGLRQALSTHVDSSRLGVGDSVGAAGVRLGRLRAYARARSPSPEAATGAGVADPGGSRGRRRGATDVVVLVLGIPRRGGPAG